MARPTKLTDEVRDKICAAIKVGATREIAALSAGICETTLYAWIKRGKDELERLEEPRARARKREASFVEFLKELETAEAEAEITGLQEIVKTGADGWKWILPRRHPGRWSQTTRQQIEHSGGFTNKVEHGIDSDTAETIFDILASIGAIKPAPDDAEDDEIHTAHTD